MTEAFSVSTYADLCKVGTGVDGWTADSDYIQTADIQCPAGSNFIPIGLTGDGFSGSYDGRGYVIRDLYINRSDDWGVGLFGEVEGRAVITNVTLEEFSITAVRGVGGLVGAAGWSSGGALIENCTVSGTISGGDDCIGGLIGYAEYATITDCHADVKILGEMICAAGGLIGDTNYCNVTSCSAQGDITYADESGGGLIGYCYDSTITDCHAHGDVTIDPAAQYQDCSNGGLVGYLYTSSAFDCSATGDVIGGDWATGGLVGWGRQSTVARCYASGNVSGYRHVGGLIGYCYDGSTITDCHAHGDVTIDPAARYQNGTHGGLIGFLYTSSTITDCHATGNVIGGEWAAGGLVGDALYADVARCYASGNVSGYRHVGGLIGYYGAQPDYSLEDCYATGNVVSSGSGPDDCSAGGLIGLWGQYDLVLDGHIKNVYSAGSVSAPNFPAEAVGGLIGQIDDGTGVVATAAYWDTETSGQATSAGGATGKTTAEMKTLATFAAWDIATVQNHGSEVWFIVEGEDYPRLAWQGLPDKLPYPIAVRDAHALLMGDLELPIPVAIVTYSGVRSVAGPDGVATIDVDRNLPDDTMLVVSASAEDYEITTKVVQKAHASDGVIIWLWPVSQYVG